MIFILHSFIVFYSILFYSIYMSDPLDDKTDKMSQRINLYHLLNNKKHLVCTFHTYCHDCGSYIHNTIDCTKTDGLVTTNTNRTEVNYNGLATWMKNFKKEKEALVVHKGSVYTLELEHDKYYITSTSELEKSHCIHSMILVNGHFYIHINKYRHVSLVYLLQKLIHM